MTKTKGIDRKDLGFPTEPVDGSQLTDYKLIDIVTLAPFRDAFHITRPAIEKPLYVHLADHVAGCETLEVDLTKGRLFPAFRKQ